MLYELENVSQKEKGKFRRWFEDDYFDLIVWYDSNRSISGFQLCYEKFGDEHALTWIEKDGFTHEKVDDYRNPMQVPVTAILVANGPFPSKKIYKRFKENSRNIDQSIAKLVIDKITEFEAAT